MKALFLLALTVSTVLIVACSKDKNNNPAVPHYGYGHNGYNQPYYGHSQNCIPGQVPAIPYNHYYYGQPLSQVNCLPSHHFNHIRPYQIQLGFGFNVTTYAGTCELGFHSYGIRNCPPNYSCIPLGLGSQGVCSRIY